MGVSVTDAGDMGGGEVHAVPVEVAAGAVVVLGGAGVGVPGVDLGVAQWDSGVEGVGDRRVTEGMGADMPRDPGGLRDAGDHPVAAASVDLVARHRSQDEWSFRTSPAAGLEV